MTVVILVTRQVVLVPIKTCSSVPKVLAFRLNANAILNPIATTLRTKWIVLKQIVFLHFKGKSRIWTTQKWCIATQPRLAFYPNGFATELTIAGTTLTKGTATLKRLKKLNLFVLRKRPFNVTMANVFPWGGYVTVKMIVMMEL